MASSTGTTAEARRPQREAPQQAAALTTAQLHALFDILTHHETYREIQDFKDPDTIFSYGTPFAEMPASAKPMPAENSNGNGCAREKSSSSTVPASVPAVTYAAHSTSPILHMLFNKAVLSLPPAKTLPPEFWHIRIQRIVCQLGEAELSESYDQGALGTRKILATAASALIESLGRGTLGGYPGGSRNPSSAPANQIYDRTDAVDFSKAWDDVLRAMVYDDLVDELFTYCAENKDIESHSPAVKAAIDYIIIHLAEFLHHVFVQSPNGKYLTKLVENIHQLAPYSVVRQTLRVSNAATMINGMMRVLLAKLSVGGLTNWMGLTSSADDGMNLLQRIVSLVLLYDSSNFKKAAEKIEKAKDGPTKAQLTTIKDYMALPRSHHEAVRRQSRDQGRSMVVCILESFDVALAASITDAQHAQCAQYYAALLSIHDRREITNVFCRQSPDLFTQAVRDGMAAFDPIIRGIHDKIDLKEHVTDIESFIGEFITISKSSTTPTVKDYVNWMTDNRHMLYKWLHRVAHDTPEIRDMFRGWAVETIKMFRADAQKTPDATTETVAPKDSRLNGGAGALSGELNAMFSALPADVQSEVSRILDTHVEYLTALDAAATQERQALLDKIYGGKNNSPSKEAASPGKRAPGSGRFIARWQELLDDTVIGPATKEGRVRYGREVANVAATGKTANGNVLNDIGSAGAIGNTSLGSRWGRKGDGFITGFSSAKSSRHPSPERGTPAGGSTPPPPERVSVGPKPPCTTLVIDAMGDRFRQLLVERF
ncbi:fungal protein [Ophiostoma piceae UAMH 11346]|uniref:Fungal protein n=1 Tax=Ophiostoma piceae (strain UAMH 11346) TaxID=1262450 RepID=S3C1G0_OPHP1|nr:fungal protein [Ophiostoma piceae UAMH 11346]